MTTGPEGALTEIGLPARQLPMALLAFNCGVEMAQLLALIALMPLLNWLAASEGRLRRTMPALAWSIVGAGVAAFLWRVAGASV